MAKASASSLMEDLERERTQALNDLLEARSRVSDLSLREQQVLLLLGAGMSNASAARVLCVSERTVKAHVAGIFEKLGVESRLQAGLVAREHEGR